MRLLTIVLLLLQFIFSQGFAGTKPVDRFFNTERLSTVSYSIYAIDAETGKIILASDQKSLSTASVMKLFTTAVAIDMLGPAFTFSTSLGYTGKIDPETGELTGDLVLKGGGDPAFYSTYFSDFYSNCFENWIRDMKTAGLKKINGRLLLDLSAMDQTSVPGGWAWDDIGNYYGAGVSALSFRDNLYEIHFASPKTEGKEVTILAKKPEIAGLSLVNKVVSSFRTGDHTIAFGAPGSLSQYIVGTIPAGNADFVVKAAMPDPPAVAARTFLSSLRENGILITGNTGILPAQDSTGRVLLSSIESPPLKELIVPLNKESLNLYAEHLLREIGRKYAGEPTIENGLKAYRQFCKDKSISDLGFFPADGSGLSRSNALSTQTLVETMKFIYDGNSRELFFGSLPVAGIDGTLKNAFKGTPLEKNVRAKTGSMERVRSLAGTMTSIDGKTILFAVILNNFDLTSQESSKLLETILLSFYNHKGE
jgi:D-alanyl-D-alanine carboxypeptidase/D-alanyl-D-alanine-endopeptidase (penicillin-binding protein 4)